MFGNWYVARVGGHGWRAWWSREGDRARGHGRVIAGTYGWAWFPLLPLYVGVGWTPEGGGWVRLGPYRIKRYRYRDE